MKSVTNSPNVGKPLDGTFKLKRMMATASRLKSSVKLALPIAASSPQI